MFESGDTHQMLNTTDSTVQIWRLAGAPQVLLSLVPAEFDCEWIASVPPGDDAEWFETLLLSRGEHFFVKYQTGGGKVLYFLSSAKSWNSTVLQDHKYRNEMASTSSRGIHHSAE